MAPRNSNDVVALSGAMRPMALGFRTGGGAADDYSGTRSALPRSTLAKSGRLLVTIFYST